MPNPKPAAEAPVLDWASMRRKSSVEGKPQAAARDGDREYRRRIDILERRISKLAGQLELREDEIQAELEQQADPGLRSVYSEVQGLDPDAENAKAKQEMMSQIFGANLKLHEAITSKQRAAQ